MAAPLLFLPELAAAWVALDDVALALAVPVGLALVATAVVSPASGTVYLIQNDQSLQVGMYTDGYAL